MPTAERKDPYNLERFLNAQKPVFEQVCAELRNGHKETHWMWFIFPQIYGLGHSSTSAHYAIRSLEEAKAYLNHPTLGARLIECCTLVNAIEGRTIRQIFGYPDDLKFRSSVTLFAQADSRNEVFASALERYFGGELDRATLARL